MEDVAWKTLIYHGESFSKFEVSTNGQLRNAITHHVYKTCVNKTGYKQVCVSLGSRNKKKVFKIHRAVAETFILNPELKPEVNHKNGNKQDNNVYNLEWATSSENIQHAYDNALAHAVRGTDAYNSKFTEEDIKYIREMYIPRDKNYGARALGRQFNVNHMSILRVIHGTRYIDV